MKTVCLVIDINRISLDYRSSCPASTLAYPILLANISRNHFPGFPKPADY